MAENSRKYQPSNGSEGMWFMGKFCEQCIHDNIMHKQEGDKQCDIIGLTMSLDIKDPEYPKEWCYDENNQPTCTEWVKWDWGNPDDDTWNEPPKQPDPPNPDQISLFPLYPDERHFEKSEPKKVAI